MKNSFASCVVASLTVMFASTATAQSGMNVPDVVACADTVGVASYARCALMIDGNKVRRGAEATVIARPGFFTSLGLERLVAGDSARKYAARYDRLSNQAGALAGIGGVALIAGLIWIHNTTHEECAGIAGCYHTDPGVGAVTTFAAGAGLLFISIPFQVHAQRAATRAVWWNNMRFAR